MFKDFFIVAFRNISQRKLRTFLTVLGIIIGVAALISLLLVGIGLDTTIKEQFEKIGTNRVYVVMKGGGLISLKEGLTEKDVNVLENIQEFSYVTPYIMQTTSVSFAKESFPLMIIGYPTKDAEQRFAGHDLTLEAGRYFKEDEKGAAIIGTKVAHDIFDKEIYLNNQLEIAGKKIKVVGIFNPIGNAQDDSTIYVPLEEARILFNKKEDVSVIEILLKEGINLQNTVKKAQHILDRQRGTDDTEIKTPDQVLGQLAEITFIVKLVLLSIAAISLVVGSLGIMTSVYTAVLERTKEIGIMKAVGGSPRHILMLFLIESGVIGLLGGIFGILLGIAIAKVVQYFATSSGLFALHIPIVPAVIIFGLCFAFIIGIIAGYFPAKQAAGLHPVDALRKRK